MEDRYKIKPEIVSNLIKLISDQSTLNDEQFVHLSAVCQLFNQTNNKYEIYFRALDFDNDGYVGVGEVKTFLTKIGFNLTEEDVLKLFGKVNEQLSMKYMLNCLEFQQFVVALISQFQ